MPPKVKIQKQDIIDSAVRLVRASGADALNARTVAAMLDCSTQPIFSHFATMADLRIAVVEAAERLFTECMEMEMESGQYPPYKASGMAYIRFARDEKELFKLLYMRDRHDETTPTDTELGDRMYGLVRENTGLTMDDSKLFHLEMWAAVHGIAAMMATGYLDLDWELVSQMVTDIYAGLKAKRSV